MSRSSHDEFLELCAIAATGTLTDEERQKLQEHLAGCSSCREAFRAYDEVANRAAVAAGADSFPPDFASASSWSLERAESSFRDRLQEEMARKGSGPLNGDGASQLPGLIASPILQRTDGIWRHMAMQYAAAVLLVVVLGLSIYRIGGRRGTQHAAGAVPSPATTAPSSPLEEQLSDASHEKEVLRGEMAQREKQIDDLRRQVGEQSAEIAKFRELQARLERELGSENAGRGQLALDRLRLTEQVEAAQAKAEGLQQRLDSLAQRSSEDAGRTANLEAKITDLTRQLHERQETVDQQQELLAHDRDIRELMGARELYIAEVYDMDKGGTPAKPKGRVFYTKGKSLIFYAYDLDQQKGLKNAKAATFQVWGRRGPDWQQALNLGVFYEDNVAKKRWIMRADDPKVLAQIDAVFVTVEPNGGSPRPSNKPFLFAYLRIEANHP